ncbi:MAG TPA: methylmalonyl Co-A mutase-associated GTPase MeaB, partial [Trebonia sp.]
RELRKAQNGDVVALSQLVSAVESRRRDLGTLLHDIYTSGGRARVVGITGPPGSGKSSLTSALLRELRQRGMRVAVVAVDPSSALTGGAILGDRLRMTEHSADEGVYVRSVSARGALGGLSRAAADIVALLDSAGWETVIVETVGVGQDEVDIMRLAHTVVVVSVPGLGDDVQAMKAGLLEVADLHVVNKADRKDAHRTTVELRAMLRLGGPRQPGQWPVPVLETIALNGTGISELADELARHQAWLGESGELDRRLLRTAAERIRSIAKEMILQRLGDPAAAGPFGALVRDVAARKIDPHTAAARLTETRERSDG